VLVRVYHSEHRGYAFGCIVAWLVLVSTSVYEQERLERRKDSDFVPRYDILSRS
jgi:hypothetical protein